MAIAMLSACQSPIREDNSVIHAAPVVRHEEKISQISSAVVQRDINTDMQVHVRSGQPLVLQTEGLSLSALDATVLHEAVYSVTSLMDDELPPLPQGMMNMTEATAGYRLLPGGEHFSPYAELRIAYDPKRLPQGYTPDDIYTSFYDTSSLAWVRLERVEVDTINHEIVSLTTHFTDFINELLKAPEMPETQAFVPTVMSDLEAVSPMDGLTTIQPPTANNNGTANLTYPLVIPAGRGGMQPNLALTYSSSGGNGWLGVGWDIPIPAITLDTRWGVPRYDTNYETEIYLLNGEQLVAKDSTGGVFPLPHRTNNRTGRLPDGSQFFARTGDAHDSIVRHGDSPKDYWWEVVDRNGTTHYYGHYLLDSASNASFPTSISDDNGNKARWMLSESRDTYGNWVRYYYEIDGTSGSNQGRQIYPSHIEYTGNNNDPGRYHIYFTLKQRSLNDIPVTCNNGFKETTSQRLCYILVKMDDTFITGYYFEMNENTYESNFKTRLKAIGKVDSCYDIVSFMEVGCSKSFENEAYIGTRQEFEYYNAPRPGSLFSREYHGIGNNDSISAFLFTPSFRVNGVDKSTALGLSHSSTWNIGGTLAAGLGADVYLTTVSLGGNYHRGGSSSESLMTLVDMDGDGLADKVFISGDNVYWRRQKPNNDSIIRFDVAQKLNGIHYFLQENSVNNTWGIQASAVGSGSGSWSKSTSTTSIYFADVDGDGLVDLVDNGQVYFNRLVNGQPNFTLYTDNTTGDPQSPSSGQQQECGSIIFDGMVDDSVACERWWEKVGEGSANGYTNAIQLCQEYSSDQDHWATWELLGDDAYLISYYVKRIDCSHRNLSAVGVPNTEAVRVWVAPDSATIQVRCKAELLEDSSLSRLASKHSDGIIYTIQHSSGITAHNDSLFCDYDTIIASLPLCDNCRGAGNAYNNTYTLTVKKGDILFFRLQSGNDKQFDNVKDEITITCNGNVYSSKDAFILTDNKYFTAPMDGHYSFDVLDSCAGVEFQNRPPDTGSIWTGHTLRFNAYSTSSGTNWDNNDLRIKIKFWSSELSDTIIVWSPCHKHIVHPDGSQWADTNYRKRFGPLYKGWGQFAYRPVKGSNENFIQLADLIVPNHLMRGNDTSGVRDRINTDIDSAGFCDSVLAAGLYRLSDSSAWVEMIADAEHNSWVSFGAQNSIGRNMISNSIQEQWYSSAATVASQNPSFSLPPTTDYDDPVPASTGNNSVKAIRKVSRSDNQSYSAGVASYGASYSHGTNSIVMDYMDLNGDRYPDIVGKGCVQYRQQWGGMGELTELPGGVNNISASSTNSIGVSFGASPISHKRSLSSNPKSAKFSLSGDGSGGGDFSIGWDNASSSWQDVNGDGLPDYVLDNGMVRLNTGYGFLDAENWNIDNIHSGMSASAAVSSDISPKLNISQGSIQLGAGLSRSANRTDYTLLDVNGDGLPDKVWRNLIDLREITGWDNIIDPMDSVHVRFNLGNGRWSSTYDINIKNFNWSETYNESLNAGVTFGTTLFGIFKATVGVNGSPFSSNVARDRMQLVDVNGDGCPDLVTSDAENNLVVRYNMGGKTNLLRRVTGFTGSRIHLSYHPSAPDYHQPSLTWLLDTVTTYDPLNPNGGDTSVTVFEYSDPNYNRYERSSFGYGSVVIKQIDPEDGSVYRKVQRNYYNTNILNNRRIRRELTSDGNDNKYIEKLYFYDYASYDGGEVDTCSGKAYNYFDTTVTRYFEGDTNPKLTVREIIQYDEFHNVVNYIDEGDTASNDDGLVVYLYYHSSPGHNLIGLRESYTVTPTGASTPQREAHFEYNGHGRLTKQTLGSGPNAPVYEFEYDTIYGNLAKGTLPENLSHQRMFYSYTYDTTVHTYPVRTDNAYGEYSSATYDYRFGKPLTVTDISHSTMTYTYDFAGRLATVTSPMSSGAPTLENRYHPVNYYHGGCTPQGYSYTPSPTGHPYSVTLHYDDAGNLITRTAVLTDGFGRVLQTKKGLTANGTVAMQVSGRTFVDALGRAIRQHDPFTSADTSLSLLGTLDTSQSTTLMATTAYDVLDRVDSTVQPLGITTLSRHDISNRRFVTTTTDPNGNITKQYYDYEGRQVQLTDANGDSTLMHYDNLGQLTWTQDPEGFQTTYDYDNLGRLVRRLHPDAGTTTFTYDPAGNLMKETNPLGEIFYSYTYYRPKEKRYSYMTGNDVTYTYGTSGNDIGRPVRITDGSGSYECTYDKLGNVTDETRTIALPQHGEVYQFRMLYQYDSWGRMLTMTYPDNEEITYTYQWGGDLYAMDGIKNGDARTYIKGISYNMYGQKEHIDYGNTTSAHYTYDALHRLVNLKSRDYGGALMQDIDYTFDNASNVTGIANNAGVVNTLGGAYGNTYKYDVLHRLEESYGGGAIGNYNTYLNYSPSGRLIGKFRVTLSASVDMAYGYCNDYQPHAVKRMFDYKNGMLYDMRWDEAGNLGQVSMGKLDGLFEAGRFLFWTEDNRMHAAVDDKHYSYYAYDYGGERRLKLVGVNSSVDVNAEYMTAVSTLNEPTLYPSAYMVLTNKGYTKHYYAGTERVAARLGGGGLDALYPVIGNEEELQKKADILFKQSIEQVNSRVLNENNLDCIMSNEFAKEEVGHPIEGIPYQMKADVECDHSQFKEMVDSMLTDYHNGEEKEVYFYHSDHLGSASWITDHEGVAVQHLQYLPYGEPYIDQRAAGTTYSERFRFTGKEKDEETGYGYFGARYMDHELMTMWLSVDPMADKYPSISPYAYCAWNPVKLVDPDGKEIHLTFIGKNTCKALNKIINEGLGGQFRAVYSKNKDGSWTLSLQATEGGGNKDKLTERQKAFYEMLSSCIDDKKIIAEISVVYGSSKTHVGNYITNTIDVADMLQFDDLGKGPCTKQGKLIHEFVEQYEKASYGRVKGEDMNRKECHHIAISAENYVNGSSREDFPVGPGRIHQAYTDNKTCTTTDYYYATKDAVLNVRKGKR